MACVLEATAWFYRYGYPLGSRMLQANLPEPVTAATKKAVTKKDLVLEAIAWCDRYGCRPEPSTGQPAILSVMERGTELKAERFIRA